MEVSARIVTLDLAETFVISRGARDTEDVVEVTLTSSGGSLQVARVAPFRVTVTATSGTPLHATTSSSRAPFADVIEPPMTCAA